MGRPSRSTIRSDCGRDRSSVQLRARKRTRSAGAPRLRRPRVDPHDGGGRRGDGARPVGHGVVEMGDAGRLAKHLQHVEVAIGVEGVARVVGREDDLNSRGLELVQERDAAPSRRAAGSSVLQVHVAHWQRDDGDAGLGDPVDRRASASSSGWRASEQQWPTVTWPAKRCRIAASAICRSERDAGSCVSSTWKSRSRPSSDGDPEQRSRPLSSVSTP